MRLVKDKLRRIKILGIYLHKIDSSGAAPNQKWLEALCQRELEKNFNRGEAEAK